MALSESALVISRSVSVLMIRFDSVIEPAPRDWPLAVTAISQVIQTATRRMVERCMIVKRERLRKIGETEALPPPAVRALEVEAQC